MSVKPKSRGRPAGQNRQLSAAIILKLASKMMEEQSKVPSIRALARELNVDAMAIYHYYTSKDALLEALICTQVESVYKPRGNGPWQAELRQLCISYLTLLQSHGGLLQTMLSMKATGPAQIFGQRFEQTLSGLSISEEVQKQAMDLLADYLHGFALAMHCSETDKGPTIAMAEGPIQFYIHALERESEQSRSQA